MDQIIELLAHYWVDWQHTAIANTRYSVVLAASAFLMGGLIMAILKRGKIVRLMRQVMSGKQQLEKSEKTHEELISKQQFDEEQITGFQKRLEDASTDVQLEKEAHHENILKKDALLAKTVDEKQQEIDAISTMLDEKNLLADRLQNDLNEQKSKITQLEAAQVNSVEIENQVNQATTALESEKQQLEDELSKKNEQVKPSYQSFVAQPSENRPQVEEVESVSHVENIQQPTINQPVEKIEVALEPLVSEVKIVPETAKIEATIEQQAHQAEVLVEKVQNQVQQSMEPTLEQMAAMATAKAPKPDVKKKGVVSKVMGWFTSIDNALEDDDVVENIQEKVEFTQKPISKESPRTVASVAEDKGSSLAEFADKMDSIQSGFKRFFKKS